MKNWQNTYDPETSALGKQLFAEGRAALLREDYDSCNWIVSEGDEEYNVLILDSENRRLTICDKCGVNCRHGAAANYALDASRLRGAEQLSLFEEEGAPESAPLFAESNNALSLSYKDPYTYYDFNAMLKKETISDELLSRARKAASLGKVKLIRAQRTFISNLGISEEGFRVEGRSVSNSRFHIDQELNLLISGQSILSATCYACNIYSYGRNRICEHLLALLILFEPYIRGKGIGDATTRNTAMMFAAYRNSEWKENNESTRSFHVEPRLIYGKGRLSLGFRGGFEKMYVIRDLLALINAWKNKRQFSQNTLDADFSAVDIEESDDPLFQMAVGFAEDRNFEAERPEFSAGFESLPLSASRLDRLFEEKAGKGLPITYRDRTSKKNDRLILTEGTYKPTVILETMDERNGAFDGIRMTVSCPNVLFGTNAVYVITNGQLMRLEKECADVLQPMLKVMHDTDSNVFQIGRTGLAQFYHRILPQLEKVAAIVDRTEGRSEAFVPPDAQFRFYLDCNPDTLFADVRVIYNDEEKILTDNGGSGLAWRDQSAEDGVAEVVKSYFPCIDTNIFYADREDDTVYRVLSEGVDRLAGIGEVQLTDRFRALRLKRKPNFRFGVSVESNVMDLELLSDDITPEELLEVLKSFREKKKYHRLRNGEFLSLEDSGELETLSDLFDTLHISLREFVEGNIHIPAYRALYLDKMMEEKEAFALERRRSYRDLINNVSSYRDNEFEIPTSMKGKLSPYQEEGFQWLMALKTAGFAGVLADDMGLGKTLQMISVLAYEKEQGSACHSLVVCPASLIYNWAEEFRRFAPELSVQLIAGARKERRSAIAGVSNYDVSITSYDLLKRDIHEYEDQVFDYEVLDEAQYIKTPSSEAAKSTKIIKAMHRFALTGTPIENRLSELWSIFDFLMPGFLYSYEVFRRELEGPIAGSKDEIAAARLRRMVSPFILRRLKENVLTDLPEKLEETIYTRFEGDQKKLYDGQVVRMKKNLISQKDSDFTRSKIQILAELTRLRQICCDPTLLYEDYKGDSAKRGALYQLMETAMEGGHKMLVFSQFASMLEIIEKDLDEKGIAYFKITGQTPKEERIRMVNAFNSDETPVFLISLKAGGTGLNLTGADTVIHFDPWWNIAAMNQASDRAHRIGQTKTVTVYRIIVKDTVEDRIVQMQEEKKDLAEAILSGESGGFASLSREDLLDILG